MGQLRDSVALPLTYLFHKTNDGLETTSKTKQTGYKLSKAFIWHLFSNYVLFFLQQNRLLKRTSKQLHESELGRNHFFNINATPNMESRSEMNCDDTYYAASLDELSNKHKSAA